MADPRAFISFDFDNNQNSKLLFAGQVKNSRTPFSIEDWSSKTALPQTAWESLIREKINKCNMLIVLVGRYVYAATGVVKEIQFAQSQNIPVFGVYVDGANFSTLLPLGLERSRVIEWDWAQIANAIDKAMREGKNSK